MERKTSATNPVAKLSVRRKRYWATASAPLPAKEGECPAELHPLLHKNTSTFKEEKFETRFQGNEFFLKDHLVGGKKVLPGVAYLEMAAAAGKIAGEKAVRKIKNIVWPLPVVVSNEPKDLCLSLNPQEDHVEYQVAGMGDQGRKDIHSRGKLFFVGDDVSGSSAPTLDIESIKKRCDIREPGDDYYRLFREMGFDYGPTFQTIKEIHRNRGEVLARLQREETDGDDANRFALHPGLLDGAIQSWVGLVDKKTMEPGISFVPFSIGEVEILKPLPPRCYAYVTEREDKSTIDSPIRKLDMTIIDEAGHELVRIKKFVVRAIPKQIDSGQSEPVNRSSGREAAEPDEFNRLFYENLLKKLADGELLPETAMTLSAKAEIETIKHKNSIEGISRENHK